MPQARQLVAVMVVFTGKDDSQLMVLSAKAEDATAVVASAAAVKVIRILMGSSPSVVICALFG
jgi:hypothetical protein